MSLTPKQEAFCLAYVETGNASEAYRRAYDAQKMKDAVIHVKASELLTNGKVAVRVKEIQEEHLKRHRLTVDDLVRQLEEVRALAIETKALPAAVSAIMGTGKLLGLVVDRKEVAGDPNNPLQVHQTIEMVIVDPKAKS